jgi:hypothetical protein
MHPRRRSRDDLFIARGGRRFLVHASSWTIPFSVEILMDENGERAEIEAVHTKAHFLQTSSTCSTAGDLVNIAFYLAEKLV